MLACILMPPPRGLEGTSSAVQPSPGWTHPPCQASRDIINFAGKRCRLLTVVDSCIQPLRVRPAGSSVSSRFLYTFLFKRSPSFHGIGTAGYPPKKCLALLGNSSPHPSFMHPALPTQQALRSSTPKVALRGLRTLRLMFSVDRTATGQRQACAWLILDTPSGPLPCFAVSDARVHGIHARSRCRSVVEGAVVCTADVMRKHMKTLVPLPPPLLFFLHRRLQSFNGLCR